MDLVGIIAKIAALRAAMVGSYAAAVFFIRAAEINESDFDNDAAINLWNDALTRAYTSKAKIDEAAKLIAELRPIQKSGLATTDDWKQLFLDLDMLETEMKDAIEKNKNSKGKAILSDDNARSEKVWRDAIAFATHWRIVPASKVPFKVTAKKKNDTLIAVAQSVSFTKESEKEIEILRAVTLSGGKLAILSESDYKEASGK